MHLASRYRKRILDGHLSLAHFQVKESSYSCYFPTIVFLVAMGHSKPFGHPQLLRVYLAKSIDETFLLQPCHLTSDSAFAPQPPSSGHKVALTPRFLPYSVRLYKTDSLNSLNVQAPIVLLSAPKWKYQIATGMRTRYRKLFLDAGVNFNGKLRAGEVTTKL